jgi:hypothetical protein
MLESLFKKKQFQNLYTGTWATTESSCGGSGSGVLTVAITRVTKTAKIKEGYLDDGYNRLYFNSGKVFYKNGKTRLYIKRTSSEGSSLITGIITPKEINGTYTNAFNGCRWSGDYSGSVQ